MPKLYSARVILSALQRANFSIISQKGSHIKLFKRLGNQTFTVIVPNHKEVAIGTFNSVLKQAGMNRKKLEEFIK